MTPKLYLRQPNQEITAVEIDCSVIGNQAIISVGELEIVGDRRAVLAIADRIAEAARYRPVNVLQISPAQVVAYFESSPILKIYADDVKSALLSHSEAEFGDFQLQQDLQAIEHLSEPTKADISEVLTGKRTYGGANYERVKQAYEAFYSSTTTGDQEFYPVEEDNLAA